MKHRMMISAALLLSSFGSVVMAQPETSLQEVEPTETIELRVNQTRIFRFDQSANLITVSNKGVAEVVPETDREFNIRGMAQGQTTLTAYGPGGKIIYRANVAVLQAGGYVKIYGAGKDFTSYYCDERGCGRADQDVAPVPFSTTASESQTRPDGTSATISREYRRTPR